MDEKVAATTEAAQTKPAMEAQPAPAGIDARTFVANAAVAYRKADGNVHVQSDTTVKAARAIAGMANPVDVKESTKLFLDQTGVDPDMFANQIAIAKAATKA